MALYIISRRGRGKCGHDLSSNIGKGWRVLWLLKAKPGGGGGNRGFRKRNDIRRRIRYTKKELSGGKTIHEGGARNHRLDGGR